MLHVGIVAGEPSGDQLGAALIAGLRERVPDVRITAMAGPCMRRAGCEELAGTEELSVMGLVEVLRHYPRLRRLRQRLVQEFLVRRPDVFIGIDVPDFVLSIETALKRAGVPTVHMVCPQVWAWRESRVGAIGNAADLLLTLFPFETTFLARHGIPARFIGHPLADRTPPQVARASFGAAPGEQLIALMPGSRRQEQRRHLPLFLAAARILHAQRPATRFVLGVLDPRTAPAADDSVDLPLTVVAGAAGEILAAADVALCVSGTITLEAALARTPAVVAYRMPRLTYAILRRLVRVPHIALPNLLTGSSLMPELIQDAATPATLAAALGGWLEDPTRVAAYRERCERLRRDLRHDAGRAAAAAVLDLVAARSGAGA